MPSGDFTWTCPAGVTTVLVELWGSGGKGQVAGIGVSGGGGGGGGAYSRKNRISVTPGNNYTVRIGISDAFAGNHESWFKDSATAYADFGHTPAGSFPPANPGSYGQPGLAANCVGDTKFSGGTGGSGVASGAGYGGASSGSRGGNGSNGGTPANPSGNSPGGVGGVPPAYLGVPQNGNGGDGGAYTAPGASLPGNAGVGPGGGGGGGGYPSGTGGPGAEGACVIWDNTSLSDWPKSGTPLATFGTPPPNPVAPFNPSYVTEW